MVYGSKKPEIVRTPSAHPASQPGEQPMSSNVISLAAVRAARQQPKSRFATTLKTLRHTSSQRTQKCAVMPAQPRPRPDHRPQL
jgi:hypothetical protein